MTEERKYTYSIIRNPAEAGSLGSANFLDGLLGIGNRAVTIIPYQDIAAAVSNTHLIDFDKLDKKELTQLIAVHDRVNTDLMKKQSIVPMRFGMIAESAEEIRNILTKAYIQFKTVFEKIAGKAEFIVQVFWNEKDILEKIVQENTEIQKLKNSAESKGRILGFSSKMKLGKRIFEALESRRKAYTTDILRNLTTSFPDFREGKLLDTTKTEVHEIDKKMILNLSFLIGATEESILEFQLNKLAEKYKDELKFKYIGPMAPYSFAVINLSVGNFDLVDNARRVFGLGESVAFPEIQKIYYKLAHEHHPDKQFFTKDQVILEEAEKKMKDIITANEILTVYCKHYLSSMPPEQEQLCSFKKEDVEDSIIIKEKQLI